jgi:DNA replication protein DnaC
MRRTDPGDAARIELLLAELRLPAVKQVWLSLAAQADKEGWPAGHFLAALAEHEIAERGRRRLERHLTEARPPPGKTLDTFDFEAVPVVSKAQVMALAAGDAWLNNGANLLLFGPPGGGKSHLAAALGFALVENGWRVLFIRTTDRFQQRPGRQGLCQNLCYAELGSESLNRRVSRSSDHNRANPAAAFVQF